MSYFNNTALYPQLAHYTIAPLYLSDIEEGFSIFVFLLQQ